MYFGILSVYKENVRNVVHFLTNLTSLLRNDKRTETFGPAGRKSFPEKNKKPTKTNKDALKMDDKTCIETVVYRRCFYACLKKEEFFRGVFRRCPTG